MLSMLRNATSSLVAKILLALLVVSFAIWGVSGSLLYGNTATVVTVGETRVAPIEFRLAYDRQYNLIQRQLNTRLTREQAESFGLTANVIQQLVSGAVLDEAAREMQLGVSDARLANIIGDDEAFRDATGRFSRAQLRSALRSIGMSEAQYVDTRKAVAIRNQIVSAVSAESALPDAFYDMLGAFRGEERKFDYAVIKAEDIGEIAEPDDAALSAYYEEHKGDYVAPEYRKLAIVKLEAADIANEGAVTDEEIAEEYEATKDRFSQPEKRTIQQLVFASEEKAREAADKLAGGMSFADLVAAEGKTLDGISLGTLAQKEIPDPALGEAAFAANLNEPTVPVKGLFGQAILNVSEILAGSTLPLADVSDQIRKQLALAKASDELYETHDRLEDERAAGEDLTAAANAVGLNARVIDWIDRTARDKDGKIISDIPQSREVLAEAFEIDPGFETNAINIGTNGFVWVDLLEIEPERQKSREEVADQLRADWIAAETASKLDALTETFRQRVADGEDFNAVIADLLPAPQPTPAAEASAAPAGDTATSGEDGGSPETVNADPAAEAAPESPAMPAAPAPRVVQQTPAINRTAQQADLPPALIASGFAQPKGSVVSGAGVAPQSRVVLRIAEVLPTAAAIPDPEREQADQQAAEELVGQFITRLRQDEKVEVNQQLIRQILAQ
ncbi:MAG: SurA N-terminal domain-containing protein [Nitratireductor sp.]|nr:SurA N-terminal domain-containing protein [Nitratireductor sp.]